MIRTLWHNLTALLGQRRCAVCGSPVTPAPGQQKSLPLLCAVCAPALNRRAGGLCPRCGAIAARADLPSVPCGQCLNTTRPWGAFFVYGVYEGLLRDVLLRFKHKHELTLAALLGALLAEHPDLTRGVYDAVLPMPLHPARLRQRGFNQSLELARPLARRLEVPLADAAFAAAGALRRVRHTPPQTRLHYNDRRQNVRGIFAASELVRDKRLLLVDDIATTCATLEEATRTLLAAGAAGVHVAVVARTPDHTMQ